MERVSANYRLGNSEALWSSLQLTPQQGMYRRAEVRRSLAERSKQLLAEFGFLRFKAKQFAFRLVELALNSAVIPLMDRFGTGQVRRSSVPRPAQA
jgi:hypothetical protein